MSRDDDGRLLFEQHTSSVPKKLRDAMSKKQKLIYKGKEDVVEGWGQEGFPGSPSFRIVAHLLHAGEVNYEEIKDLL